MMMMMLCVAVTVEAEEEQSKEAPTRVLGVGVGVFLLVFFFIVGCAICWVGSIVPEDAKSVPPQSVFNAVGTGVFSLVALILFFADTKPQYSSNEPEVVDYRKNLFGLALVSALAFVAAGLGIGAVLCYHVCQDVEPPSSLHMARDDDRYQRRSTSAAAAKALLSPSRHPDLV